LGNELSLFAVKELLKRPGGREIWRNPKPFVRNHVRGLRISLALHPLRAFYALQVVCLTNAKCKEQNAEEKSRFSEFQKFSEVNLLFIKKRKAKLR